MLHLPLPFDFKTSFALRFLEYTPNFDFETYLNIRVKSLFTFLFQFPFQFRVSTFLVRIALTLILSNARKRKLRKVYLWEVQGRARKPGVSKELA